MDIVTHGLLGALTAMAVSRSRPLHLAAVCGAVGALLPDADVLISSSTDPLLTLEYHRQFTHSFAFAPLGALLASLLVRVFARSLPWSRIYLFALTGYLSAILLDACTSYGTQLLWPFSDHPFTLSIIAVVDPVFSLFLIAGVVGALCFHSRRAVRVSLLLAAAYLLAGLIQHWRAETAAIELSQERNLQPIRIIVKPTMGNILLWRSLIVADNVVWADAIRPGLPGQVKVYPGERMPLLDPSSWQQLPQQSPAYRSLQRFYELTDRMLVAHPEYPGMIGDARYAMLPTEVAPLWGIEVQPEQPFEQVELVTRRDFTPAVRQRFLEMLSGNGGTTMSNDCNE